MVICCSCNSGNPTIIRGNKAILRMTLNADGAPITTLAAALSARFVAIDRNGDIILDKGLADMDIDTPTVGSVSLDLSSFDTDIPEGTYQIAIQFTWGAADSLEWNFGEPLNIIKGLIP